MQRIAIEAQTGKSWDILDEGTFQGRNYYDVIDPASRETRTLWVDEVGTIALRDPNA